MNERSIATNDPGVKPGTTTGNPGISRDMGNREVNDMNATETGATSVPDLIDSIVQSITDKENAGNELVRQASQQQDQLRREANAMIEIALRSLSGDDQKRLASLIYWNFKPYIWVSTISDACDLPGVYAVSKWVYPLTQKLNCRDCGVEIEVPLSSRTSPYPESYVCSDCKVAQDQQYEINSAEYAQRVHILKTMPYADYLQTAHWQRTRSGALKRAKYRCQICNTNQKALHVHHRTYERRGEEYARDLIVLCEDCHRTFHENGQLAGGE